MCAPKIDEEIVSVTKLVHSYSVIFDRPDSYVANRIENKLQGIAASENLKNCLILEIVPPTPFSDRQ